MLKQRIITAIVALVALLVALFVLPPMLTRAIIAALMVIAAWEWSAFLAPHSTALRATYTGTIAAVGATAYWLSAASLPLESIMLLAVAWWSVAFAWLFFYPTGIPSPVGWASGILVIVPAWLALDWLYQLDPLSLLTVLGIVWAADIGAYFAGKAWGRVKLAPAISPGKTWEGVLGGLALVAVFALLLGVGEGRGALAVMPLFLAVAIVSVVGDLTVSMFKRNCGVKDSGRLFPGHGGVLDRIDSATAAMPLYVVGGGWAGLL